LLCCDVGRGPRAAASIPVTPVMGQGLRFRLLRRTPQVPVTPVMGEGLRVCEPRMEGQGGIYA
jgi:hypothetical protein